MSTFCHRLILHVYNVQYRSYIQHVHVYIHVYHICILNEANAWHVICNKNLNALLTIVNNLFTVYSKLR